MSKWSDYFLADDGTKIYYFKWIPEKEITGIVLIAHGMAEHSERYDDFANFLNKNSFAVFANDHRGHGKTAGSTDKVGFVSGENGWEIMVKDFLKMKEEAKKQCPAKPLFALGHSMGTFIIRDIAVSYTHLDVYKRQPQYISRIAPHKIRIYPRCFFTGRRNFQ